jgi:hypothetical protein
MKMKLALLVFTGLVPILVAGTVNAAPQELSLMQLDSITAGNTESSSASGGAIIAGGSTGTVSSTGTVEIGEGVQADARALNMVNSSESTVANGVNIFDGRVEGGAALDGTNFDVTQGNQITQDQRRNGNLSEYVRADNNVTSTSSSVGSSVGESSLDLVDRVSDIDTTVVTTNNTIDGSVTTGSQVLGQEVRHGKGVAISGNAQLDITGAPIEFHAGLFGGVSTFDATTGLKTVEVIGDANLDLIINIPDIVLEIQGAGCWTVLGSCEANGSYSTVTDQLRDLSTENTTASAETHNDVWNINEQTNVRGPMSVHGAQAEYIVVDESEINVDSTYIVSLTGGAQSAMQGMNVVNAAGSAVANGVNIAQQRSGELAVAGGPLLNLSQANVIVHSR